MQGQPNRVTGQRDRRKTKTAPVSGSDTLVAFVREVDTAAVSAPAGLMGLMSTVSAAVHLLYVHNRPHSVCLLKASAPRLMAVITRAVKIKIVIGYMRIQVEEPLFSLP